MKPKRRRLIYVLGGLGMLGIAVGLVLSAFEEGIVFFYSPSDMVLGDTPRDRTLRLGGLVEEGSVVRGAGIDVSFRVTDLDRAVEVKYSGILPDLFREGQGVVALGTLGNDGVFRADEVLAKHDETYMPPEVAEAIKKADHWQEAAD